MKLKMLLLMEYLWVQFQLINLQILLLTTFDKRNFYKKVITIILKIGDPRISLNGVSQEIDPGRDTTPIIKNGRTLAPIRAIIKALGGTVEWKELTKAVSIRLRDTLIKIGNSMTYVNGSIQPISPDNPNVKPEIISGRTVLPLGFVAENLGAKVDWDGATKTITITYKP